MRTLRILAIASGLLLSACSVLLPQSNSSEEVGVAARNPGVVVVEEAVEILPPGSAASTGDIGPTTVEIVGGDDAALREFVERWMGSTYPGQPANLITVYLGSLPPDLPYELPIPDDARVIGSVLQTNFTDLQVILETTLTPGEAVAFYEAHLPELGWVENSNAGFGGGFMPGDMGSTFCLGDDTSLNLQAGTWPSGATDVRIFTFSNRAYSPCNPDPQYGQDSISALIPALNSPPGAVLSSVGGGGSSGDFNAYNETQITTDLSAGELAAYYSEQLEAAGWTLLESGESEGHAWSSWSFTDEDGQALSGTLVLLEVPPGSGTIFAYIQVAR